MSKPNTQIVVSSENGAYRISIPGEVFRLKQDALDRANKITEVTTHEQQVLASSIAGELKGLSSAMENTREMVKKPFLQVGRSIDDKAKAFREDLDARARQLDALSANFIQRERQKILDQEREREAEKRRVENEAREEQQRSERAQRAAEEAQREAQAAENRRLQAELAAQEAQGRAERAKAARELAAAQEAQRVAEAERQRLEAARETAELQASEAQDAADEIANTDIVEESKPTHQGGSFRTKIIYEIDDIEALYAWDLARRKKAKEVDRNLPSFVKLEIRTRDFDQYIQMLDDAERDSIPGVRFQNTPKFHSNITKPTLQIQ